MEQGYGKPRKEVKGLVEKVSREKGVLKKSKVSNGWLRRFLERNFERHFERQPVLTLWKGDATATVQMHCKESILQYFKTLWIHHPESDGKALSPKLPLDNELHLQDLAVDDNQLNWEFPTLILRSCRLNVVTDRSLWQICIHQYSQLLH